MTWRSGSRISTFLTTQDIIAAVHDQIYTHYKIDMEYLSSIQSWPAVYKQKTKTQAQQHRKATNKRRAKHTKQYAQKQAETQNKDETTTNNWNLQEGLD